MKPLSLLPDGRLSKRWLAAYGGEHSLLSSWRMKGTGSGRLVYFSGLPHFDERLRGSEGEVPLATMELLREGLLLRLNVNQRVACAGVALADFHEALLERQRGIHRWYDRHAGVWRESAYDHGILYLAGAGFEVKAVVLTREYLDVVSFFDKPPLRGRLRIVDVAAEQRADYTEQLVAVIRLLEAIQ